MTLKAYMAAALAPTMASILGPIMPKENIPKMIPKKQASTSPPV